MIKLKLFILLIYSINIYSQTSKVGIQTLNPQALFHTDGAKDNPVIGTPSLTQSLNDFVITDEGKIGIGIIAPNYQLQLNSGITNQSGLLLENLKKSTNPSFPVNEIADAALLAVDADGVVVVNGRVPQTKFKAFRPSGANGSLNAPVSLIAIGGMEFRLNDVCVTSSSSNASGVYMQARSTTGQPANVVVSNIRKSNQNLIKNTFGPEPKGTIPETYHSTNFVVNTSFQNLTFATINCYWDGHLEFDMYNLDTKELYRVNFHIADGDGLRDSSQPGNPLFGNVGYNYVKYYKY